MSELEEVDPPPSRRRYTVAWRRVDGEWVCRARQVKELVGTGTTQSEALSRLTLVIDLHESLGLTSTPYTKEEWSEFVGK